METTLTAPRPNGTALLEQVVVGGDLSKLTPAQRLGYYADVCQSLGLNPLTRPFEYITLGGRLVLYARRDATDQLRRLHNVDLTIAAREKVDDVYIVTARATVGHRSDESIGAVSLGGLKGEALANAMMKAETKAKRRVTLSIVGLGLLDETEVADVGDAQATVVDHATGEITSTPRLAAPAEPAKPEPTREQYEAAYLALMDKADVLSIPAEHFDPKWANSKLGAAFRDLKAKIKDREETESAKAKNALPPLDEQPA